MTKVFEALERHQKSRIKKNGREPLVAETEVAGESSSNESSPDSGNSTVPGNDATPGNEIAGNGIAGYELPSVIGAPAGSRSSEGMLFPSLSVSLQQNLMGETAGPTVVANPNGKAAYKPEPSRPQIGNPESRPSSESQAHHALGDKDARHSLTPSREKEPVLAPREIPVEQIVLPLLHPRLILLTDPGASECEQYRTLRTQLFHAAEKKLTQVVVITSALPGEGKTATTLNLAFAIAQSREHRVLVVDGDLRRPSIASYLGVQSKTGLGEVLAGASGPLDSIFCLDEYDLYVLPVSRDLSNPTELLSSERLDKMIEEMRAYFDFILVDSPPVMPFADTRLLTNHSDSIILVVRAGLAPYETVEKSIEALPPGRIMGVVLNHAETPSSADYYDYYYNYTERAERRSSFWRKIKQRVVASWLGKRMDLR